MVTLQEKAVLETFCETLKILLKEGEQRGVTQHHPTVATNPGGAVELVTNVSTSTGSVATVNSMDSVGVAVLSTSFSEADSEESGVLTVTKENAKSIIV